jgi:hypothetical protein
MDPHYAELSAVVARAEANRAEMSRLQAERAEVCAAALDLVALRVAQRAAARPGGGGGFGDTVPLREVLTELAAALHVTERTISTWLGDGAALVGTYTATLAALREGRIDERHASAIIDAGMPLTPENREAYEQAVLPIAETETAPATRDYARAIASRLQPDIVAANHRRALEERRVRTYDLDDGLSRLLLDAPTALIHGIYERLTMMGITQGEIDADLAAASGPTEAGPADAERDPGRCVRGPRRDSRTGRAKPRPAPRGHHVRSPPHRDPHRARRHRTRCDPGDREHHHPGPHPHRPGR